MVEVVEMRSAKGSRRTFVACLGFACRTHRADVVCIALLGVLSIDTGIDIDTDIDIQVTDTLMPGCLTFTHPFHSSCQYQATDQDVRTAAVMTNSLCQWNPLLDRGSSPLPYPPYHSHHGVGLHGGLPGCGGYGPDSFCCKFRSPY
jgi:hypothetical protein